MKRSCFLAFCVACAGYLIVCTAFAEDRQPSAGVDKSVAVPCRKVPVDVSGASQEERQLICEAAVRATELFGQCEFETHQRIRVHVTNRPPTVCGVDAFGSLDVKDQRIRLVDAQTCRKMANANAAYASLPYREFYKSLVVHEVAHHIFRSNLDERAVSHATHEYVAYAIQIASMPSYVRDRFLNSFRRKPPTDLSPFVDMVYLMAPAYFGALAYDHFSAPGNGCRILREIVEGQIEFPTLEALE